jgi:hypothetical protein
MKSILQPHTAPAEPDLPASVGEAHDDTLASLAESGTILPDGVSSLVEPFDPGTFPHPISSSAQKKGRSIQIADMEQTRQLIDAAVLTPFRLFRCFEYSASLFLHEEELTYYVTLHQDNVLSRALSASDMGSAESAFLSFEAQVSRLSSRVARRVQLEAENRRLVRLIAQSQAQVERAHENLREGSAQAQAIATRQHQLRKDVAQLEARLAAAQAYLDRLGRENQRLALISNRRLPHFPG